MSQQSNGRGWNSGRGRDRGSARGARGGRAGNRGAMNGAFEQLEPRALLSGAGNAGGGGQDGLFAAGSWRGGSIELVRKDSWLITFNAGQPQAQAEARVRGVAASLGVEVGAISVIPSGRVARLVTTGAVTPQAVDRAVSQMPFLKAIGPERGYKLQRTPNDPGFTQQWGSNNTGQTIQGTVGTGGADVDAQRAWDRTTGSDRVVIAVLDTGVETTHEDLAANIWRNPREIPFNGIDDDNNGYADDISGYDFASGDGTTFATDNDPTDTDGHGTAVAGVIGAVGGNAIGVAGVAWRVNILPVKIFPEGGGNASQLSIAAAYDYVITLKNAGVNIVAINASYGGLSDSTVFDPAEESEVQSVTNAGILFIAAAGNESTDNDGAIRGYPASYPNPDIISVAATTNRDLLAGFSNFGRTTVDLGAPGEGIWTTTIGNTYTFIDGTSFAAPYTTGVVALMAAARPGITKAELRNTLLANVDPVIALNGRTLTGGRLNADRAVSAIATPGPLVAAVTPGAQASTVTEIQVSFTKPIATFNPAAIELKRANGAPTFNGSETDFSLAGSSIALSPDGRLLTITLNSGALPRDLFRLILRNTGFQDVDGNFLNGDATTGRDELYDFNVVAFNGPNEPNDTIVNATPLIFDANGLSTLNDQVIGDGASPQSDVDIFRVFISGPGLIAVEVTGRSLAGERRLDTFARLFDANGLELAQNDNFDSLNSALQFFVPASGRYFIGITAFPNTRYDPNTVGSGTAGDTTGNYDLRVQTFVPPNEQAVYGSTTSVPIPEVGTRTSTIFVPDGRSIVDAGVRVNITHGFIRDLSLTLTSPTGAVIALFTKRGAPGANLTNTLFVSSGTGSDLATGTAPFTGRFRPESPLTALASQSAGGVWTLTVTDDRPLDAGTLTSWSLELTLANDVFGTREPNDTRLVATDTAIGGRGAATFNGTIGDGTFGLRDVDVFRLTAEAGTTLTVTSRVTDASPLTTILRLFDSSGTELRADRRKAAKDSAINFVVATSGVYYVGLSGGSNDPSPSILGNDNYLLDVGGSGNPTDSTGQYQLTISVAGGISENSVLLAGSAISAGVSGIGTLGATKDGTSIGLGLGSSTFDFLRPANTLSYFGGTADGAIFRNASDLSQVDVPVTISTESDFTNRRVVTSGQFRSLGLSRTLSFSTIDLAIAVDVVLTNRSSVAINTISWMEGFDPTPGNAGAPTQRLTINNSRNFVNPTTGPVLATAVTPTTGQTIGLAAAAGSYNVVTSFNGPGRDRDPIAILASPIDPDTSMADTGVLADREMTIAFNIGGLGAGQSARFRYFILMGDSLSAVTTQFDRLVSGTGTGHLVADPRSLSIPAESLPYKLYYPEGYANNRAATYLPIVNSQSDGTRVVVLAHYEDTRFSSDVLFDSATDNASTGGLVPATVRGGITLTNPSLYASGTSERVQSEIAGRPGVRKDTPYAVEVRSSSPVGAVFSHYDAGISTGQSAVSELSSVWTFGEVQKGANVADYLVLFNPGATSIKVSMTAYPTSGVGVPVTLTGTLGPNRRGGWSVKDIPQIRDGRFGVRIDADAPIVAALTHYDASLNGGRGQGYATVGLPGLGATSGGTGQGQIGLGALNERVSVFNPSSAPASVTLNFAFADGNAFRRTVAVQPLQFTSIEVASLPGFPAGQSYGVTYVSDRPVAVSLPSFSAAGSSGAVLVNRGATQWLFAEGFRPLNSTSASDFLRVYNPSTSTTTVEITLSFNDGTSELFRRDVPAKATANYNLFDFVTGYRATTGTVAGVGSYFGTKLTSSTPVVAFMGHYDESLLGGFGITGTPIGGTVAVS
jgi:subtilisin family serine protease/subtilisin-like proprotein convertase family protein